MTERPTEGPPWNGRRLVRSSRDVMQDVRKVMDQDDREILAVMSEVNPRLLRCSDGR